MKKRVLYICVYYLVLLCIMVSWTNPNAAPPTIVRLVFMGAVFIPTVYLKNGWLPAVLTCFLSIGQYGISFSYMPETISLYMWLMLALFILYGRKKNLKIFPRWLYVFPFYIILIDLFADNTIYHIFYALIVTCLASYLFGNDYDDAEKKMSIAFIVVTIVLCYYFLFFSDKFSESYGQLGAELERVLWTDPNYLGCVIGMGTICCGIKLTDKSLNRIIRFVLLAVIGLSFIVLIQNASRGALVAVLLGCSVLYVSSPVKVFYKLLFLCLVITFIVFLYNNSYFDLLEYRMGNDSTGSGRTIIWERRLTEFFQAPSLSFIFGYGHDAAMTLGTPYRIGSHNDYVAFLVEYGIIGFASYLYMLAFPIIKILKKGVLEGFYQVLTLSVYIAVGCFTLEPFTLGRIPFYMFYLYMILVVNKYQKKAIAKV